MTDDKSEDLILLTLQNHKVTIQRMLFYALQGHKLYDTNAYVLAEQEVVCEL